MNISSSSPDSVSSSTCHFNSGSGGGGGGGGGSSNNISSFIVLNSNANINSSSNSITSLSSSSYSSSSIINTLDTTTSSSSSSSSIPSSSNTSNTSQLQSPSNTLTAAKDWFTYVYKIENIEDIIRSHEVQQNFIQSQPFQFKNHFLATTKQNSNWRLIFYPNGAGQDCKNFLSIFLKYLSDEPVKIQMMFSIVNNNNEDVYVKYTVNKFNKSNDWGFKQLIHKNAILFQQNKFLKSGALSIRIKMRLEEHKNEYIKKLNDNLHYCKILSENFAQYYYQNATNTNNDDYENATSQQQQQQQQQQNSAYCDISLVVHNSCVNTSSSAVQQITIVDPPTIDLQTVTKPVATTTHRSAIRRKSSDNVNLSGPPAKRFHASLSYSQTSDTTGSTNSRLSENINEVDGGGGDNDDDDECSFFDQNLTSSIKNSSVLSNDSNYNNNIVKKPNIRNTTTTTTTNVNGTKSSSKIETSSSALASSSSVLNDFNNNFLNSNNINNNSNTLNSNKFNNSEQQQNSCFDKISACTGNNLNGNINNNSGSGVPEPEVTVFNAHKCILAARSPVFKAMFNYRLKENLTNRVVIEDCRPEVVKAMLKYIYTASLPDDINSIAIDLFIAAEKYYIESLKLKVREHLVENLCCENVIQTYILSELYDDSMLRKQSLKYITENIDEVTQNSDWDEYLKIYPQFFTNAMKRLCKKIIVEKAK